MLALTQTLIACTAHRTFPCPLCLCLQKMYPLAEIQLIGSVRLPRGVDRTKLEVRHVYNFHFCHLSLRVCVSLCHSIICQTRTSGQCSR